MLRICAVVPDYLIDNLPPCLCPYDSQASRGRLGDGGCCCILCWRRQLFASELFWVVLLSPTWRLATE